MITIPGLANHRRKIDRAIAMSDYASHPGLHRAALSYIPAEAIAMLPARVLAQMIDKNVSSFRASQRIERQRICEEGHVWDERRYGARELSDPITTA